MKNHIRLAINPSHQWLLLVVLLLSTTLSVPSRAAVAQVPDPTPPPPAAERYGDLTAMPVLPMPGVQPQVDDHFEPTDDDYECATLSADKYSGMVVQTYNGSWTLLYLPQCTEYKPTWVTVGGRSNAYPQLNRGATRIVYASDEAGNMNIHSVSVDSSNRQQLTEDGATDTYPTWSPDGSMIAFTSNRTGSAQIYLMRADGSDERQFSTNPLTANVTPDWSPDGKNLAWVEASGENGQIVIADLNNLKGLVSITPPLRYLSSPKWSRDGSRLAFEYDANGDGFLDLGVVNRDGTGFAQINQVTNPTAVGDYSIGSWSASGRSLSFSFIRYIVYQGKWYIDWTNIARVSMIGDRYLVSHQSLPQGVYFYPHTQPIDITAPVTQFDPLPRYSPASGFQVTWRVMNDGPSNLYRNEVKTRIKSDTNWIFWQGRFLDIKPGEIYQETAIYSGNPGSTVYFRGFAQDQAENVETPKQSYEYIYTQLYTWMSKGKIFDSRDNPLDGIRLSSALSLVNEPISDSSGSVETYFSSSGNAELQVNAPGTASSAPISVSENQLKFLGILTPPENSLTNGDFEAPILLDAWQTGGTLPLNLTGGHSGSRAAKLGTDCALPCLSSASHRVAAPFTTGYGALIQAGPDGTVHILKDGYYIEGSPQRIYSEAKYLLPNFINYSTPRIVVDPFGNLHLLMAGEDGLHYLEKPQGEDWKPDIAVTSVKNQGGYDLAVDSQGRVHILHTNANNKTLLYHVRSPQGDWAPTQTIFSTEDNDIRRAFLAVGPDSTIHIIHNTEQLDGYQHEIILPDGTIQKGEIFGAHSLRFLVAGPDGSLHAFTEYFDYFTLPVGGTWKEVGSLYFPYTANLRGVTVDKKNTLHMVIQGQGPLGWSPYYIKKSNEAFFHQVDIPLPPGYFGNSFLAISIEPGGKIHLLEYASSAEYPNQLYHQESMVNTQDELGSLSQVVSIPENMHQPTLSFVYQFPAMQPGANGGLSVSVTPSEGEAETVFTSQAAFDWQHGWVDLSKWAGETVTITFTNRQGQDDLVSPVEIDEVSLGSWATPLVESLDPAQEYLSNGQAVVVTITGQNFMEGAQVRVDGQPVEQVTWVDENHLQFTMPGGLKAGYAKVTVVNPGDAHSNRALRFEVGQHIYLPVTRH